MKSPEERLRARHFMARRGSGGGRVVAETARAVLASDVKYAVVDFPGSKGPCLYAGHPTWVPVEAKEVGYGRNQGMRREQLPLVLAYGTTIHKAQGLTLRGGCVVDCSASGGNRPWAKMGLPYVGMSRCTDFKKQGFRWLPNYFEFREVLREELYRKRRRF